ncbi:MAG: sugar phosphate isomerase/epimerase [Eubacteriales bacterium]|nr:sugar phosphate isomerase/epimerase [Eubacteriales bacterium]
MKIGIESFTIMDDFYEDFYKTLKKVENLGLHYVEWIAKLHGKEDYGLGLGLSPQEAARAFSDYGMKLQGGILWLQTPELHKNMIFDYDEMQKVIDWYAEAGCTHIGLAGDWFVNEEFFKRRMEAYNELGRRCQDAGMVWTYHNHFHEQQKINGKSVLELMVEYTDPDSVGFDWDVYWGVRGLVDPVENIKKLGSKIKCMHCKDFPFSRLDSINIVKELPEDELVSWENENKFAAYEMVVPEDFIEVGKGIIKWQEVIDAANEIGIPYMYIEQDYTQYADKFESLAASRDYLFHLKGLEVR